MIETLKLTFRLDRLVQILTLPPWTTFSIRLSASDLLPAHNFLPQGNQRENLWHQRS